MFGIGPEKLLIILWLALIVLGPRRARKSDSANVTFPAAAVCPHRAGEPLFERQQGVT